MRRGRDRLLDDLPSDAHDFGLVVHQRTCCPKPRSCIGQENLHPQVFQDIQRRPVNRLDPVLGKNRSPA